MLCLSVQLQRNVYCRPARIVSGSNSSGCISAFLLRGAAQLEGKKKYTMVAAEQGTHLCLLVCLR